MPLSTYLLLALTHPNEFRTLVQYKLWHSSTRELETDPTSGWERESMRKCWAFLDMTSRSFAAVIKELEGGLARTICLYYLVLRGLDTIEDDMTLDAEYKPRLLRAFHKHTITPGWTFTESGPNEKDRQLLVEYDVVVAELLLLPPAELTPILDIAAKMGNGMADFALRPAGHAVEGQAEYDLYCHYVAGLVGEGLSAIFAASGKEGASLARQLVLSNSMGIFLQKTNVTRDVCEDAEEGRFFYPATVYAPYGFPTPREMCPTSHEEKDVPAGALWVQSAMVANALTHAPDALEYLRLLKNQSVFNFCAIPAAMAVATLELCFMNPGMFVRNVKIRKAVAADLIMRSKNPREVSLIFREYARKIHARMLPHDPNFMKLSVVCGKIEQWHEHAYPSFVQLPSSGSMTVRTQDPRGAVFVAEEKAASDERRRRQLDEVRRKMAEKGMPTPGTVGSPLQSDAYTREAMTWVIGIMLGFLLVGSGLAYWTLWYAGRL
uniref:Squalene synthase n=1 Tax=Mycena chlorophos TaxID=658473 RepID=A0ABQ0L8Y7_MYCCL|nr:predicted protein [Mycena chlorophos]